MSGHFAVIGAGAWGSTVAKILAENGNDVKIWAYEESTVSGINERHVSDRLAGVTFPESIVASSDLAAVVLDAKAVVIALASSHLGILESVSGVNVPVLILTKGFYSSDLDSLFVSDAVQAMWDLKSVCVLSGPNLALEIAGGLPAASVVASSDASEAAQFQDWLTNSQFRVYTSDDVYGVALGGILKNVIAVAAGIVDGLELGCNAKSALVARGLREMTLFGHWFLGVQEETFYGLSGVGDLVTTCVSPQSRNWSLGNAVSQSESVQAAVESFSLTAEGYRTVAIVKTICEDRKLDLPIMLSVYRVLYGFESPKEVFLSLMQRPVGVE